MSQSFPSPTRTGLRAWLLVPLLTLALAACGGGADPMEPSVEDISATGASLTDVRVRLMAANITSGNLQSYDPGHGLRIFQGTKPDVVMIQEFNYGNNSASAIRGFVDTAFGPGFHYYREGGAQIPNGVISRWPILAAGEWDDPYVANRDFAWARIDIPGPRDLWVVSVHLLTDGSKRNPEAINLVQRIQANIPAGDFLSIAGDFNTDSRTESCLTTFKQVVVTDGPHPADKNGREGTNASREKPYDHVLVDADLRAYQTATVIGGSTFPAGLVVDTRVYSPLSEISPAQSGDSGATNMQHMAVIKDFLIPGDGSTPPPTPTSSVKVTSPNGGESWAAGGSRSITWTASNVTNVKLEYTTDGSAWSVISASTPASTGTYTWTVPAMATTAAKVRVSDAADATLTDVSDAAFTITVTTTPPPTGSSTVIINEFLANEPGSDVTKEFVELVNVGTSAVDLSGWTVSDSGTLRHTFASGTTLEAGKAVVVFGGAAGIPAGLTNAVAASTTMLGLTNSGDTINLKDAAGTVVDTITFGSTLAEDGVSANRSPDFSTGSFVLHTSLSTLSSSPGKRVDGTDFGGGSTGGGGTGTVITSETESTDTAASANGRVAAGKNVSGNVSSATDVDWFKFTVDAPGTVTVSLSMPGGADLDWYLYSASDLNLYLERGYSTSNPELGSYSVSAAGTYYVKVVGYAGATGSYTLAVTGAGVQP
jgi:endonuclease/exonuclease/phosphatase family metal-dependent hydrolase